MNAIPLRPGRVPRIAAALFTLVAFAAAAHADIFQWEYIDPADPSQGKQQSTTLAPDGAGVDPVRGAQLYYRDLTMAHLIGTDLRDASAVETNLTDADLRLSNLTNANFQAATLTDAEFTGAAVRGATFDQVRYGGLGGAWAGTGLSLAQLYSTASYQARDLSGIRLGQNNLVSGDFRGQNLTNANFVGATLTDADFTDAEIAGASFHKDYYVYAPSAGTGITLAQLYATANYKKRDLSGVGFWYHDFTGGNFAGQELTQADFHAATLTDADFTGADVRRANFGIYANCTTSWGCFLQGTGLTLEQLYSTASYKSSDLRGVELQHNSLAGGNFAGQNLTNANFHGAPLTDADFTDADVRGASLGRSRLGRLYRGGITLAQLYSTASYQARDLSGIDLSSCNIAGGDFAGLNLASAGFYAATLTDTTFRQANLTNARFDSVTLTDTDFTGADIRGASFGRDRFNGIGGIPLAQLYSTASYQAKDLSGIRLSYDDLNGGNFAGQNVTNASFGGATLTNADFTAADARGASLYQTDAITTNLIWPDGHVSSLVLDAGALLLVRDYDGNPFHAQPALIPITVDQHLAMAPGGTLRMVFEADAWDSTISFAPGIPVALGGTLELTFADDVNLASQVGRTFDLFDWTGVTPTGAFDISSPYSWDLSNLYTTGEVTLTAMPEPTTIALAAVAAFCGRRLRRRLRAASQFGNPSSLFRDPYYSSFNA